MNDWTNWHLWGEGGGATSPCLSDTLLVTNDKTGTVGRISARGSASTLREQKSAGQESPVLKKTKQPSDNRPSVSRCLLHR